MQKKLLMLLVLSSFLSIYTNDSSRFTLKIEQEISHLPKRAPRDPHQDYIPAISQEIISGVELVLNPTGESTFVGGGGSGDVKGPPYSTDNAVARFNGTSGDKIQNSGVIINDSNQVSGATEITVGNVQIGTDVIGVGTSADVDQTLLQVRNGAASLPTLTYKNDYYLCKGPVYVNENTGQCTLIGVQSQDDLAQVASITGNRAAVSKVALLSDANLGACSTDDLRRWEIEKTATDADLSFKFFNSDTGDGKPAVNTFSLVDFDGFNKLVTFASPTILQFGSDTNLYRQAANTLKTDDALQVGGALTAQGGVTIDAFTTAGVVHNSASGVLSSSLIVNDDVAASAGIVDTKLATISTAGKVANSATTATDADTASAIVARDVSGNFSAGTITASLTGAASLNVLKAGDTMTGSLTMGTENQVRFQDSGGTKYVSLQAPSAIGTTYSLTLPTNVGSIGQILTAADGSGTLQWSTNTGASAVTTIANVGSSPNAAAATIASNTLTLQPANGSFPGVVTTGTQTFAGTKNFSAIGGTNLTIDGNPSVGISTSSGDTTIGRDAAGTVVLDGATLDIDADVVNVELLTASQAVVTDASKNLTSLAYTDANTASTLVQRDASGNFTTNQITIVTSPTNDSDVATKAYVDASATGLEIKEPSKARADSNVASLSGTTTIDGVSLVADDRVLLTNQTTGSENGIWEVKAGAWQRPSDFPNGGSAANAYTFIEEGTNYANSSYVCTNEAPNDVIDTDSLTFVQFSSSENVTGSNVGSGTGEVFRDKTGSTLNFKTTVAGTHMTVTNNTNDITLSTDATSANTSGTIVARNGSGDFSAGTITATSLAGATIGINGSSAVNISTSSGDTTIGRDAAGTVVLDGATLDIDADVVNVELLTASQAVVTDASKNLASLAYTDANTASALVQRDASGDFSAGTITASLTGNVTGSASLNVLKTGDTMTGALNMATENEVRFQDASGGQYVGLKAPDPIATSLTFALPNADGSANQVMVTDGNKNLSFASRVAGPGSSTDHAVARYNGTDGQTIQDSSVIISDADAVSGVTQLDVDNIQLDGNSITSTDTNGNINITPDGSGNIVLDGLSWPNSDGTNGQVLQTNGNGTLSFADGAGDTGFVSVFGDQIVTNRVNQISLMFQYNLPTDVVTVTTNTTGTVVQTQGLMKLNTGTGSAGVGRAISKDVLHYSPGHESAVFFTAAWPNGAAADSYQYIGLYDDNDGWAIGYNGANFGVLFRRDGGTDTFINQASFNLDPLDGTGPSGFTLNQTKINVFRIAYGWLGSAPITFYVINPNGNWIAFHRIEQPNASDEPSVINPTLPMRAEAVNDGNTTDLEMRTVCWNGTSQGPLVSVRSYVESSLGKTVSSTEIPLLTIRNKTTFATQVNKTTIRSIFGNFGVEDNDLILFNLVKNASLTGASYTDVDASFSVAEVDTSASAVTGGTTVYTTMAIRDAGSADIFYAANDINIFLRPGETITLTGRALSGSSQVNVVYGWDEIQ